MFVNLPGIGQHPAESILLNHTADSMTLDLKDFSGVAHQQLHLLLKKKVKGAKLKQKSDKLLITLPKARPKTNWYSLTRKDTESTQSTRPRHRPTRRQMSQPRVLGWRLLRRRRPGRTRPPRKTTMTNVQQAVTSSSKSPAMLRHLRGRWRSFTRVARRCDTEAYPMNAISRRAAANSDTFMHTQRIAATTYACHRCCDRTTLHCRRRVVARTALRLWVPRPVGTVSTRCHRTA